MLLTDWAVYDSQDEQVAAGHDINTAATYRLELPEAVQAVPSEVE